jgi:hypothetical protein
MTAQPKRLPGEPNPRADAPFVNTDRASGGRGNDHGIARGLFALLDRIKRRRAARIRR